MNTSISTNNTWVFERGVENSLYDLNWNTEVTGISLPTHARLTIFDPSDYATLLNIDQSDGFDAANLKWVVSSSVSNTVPDPTLSTTPNDVWYHVSISDDGSSYWPIARGKLILKNDPATNPSNGSVPNTSPYVLSSEIELSLRTELVNVNDIFIYDTRKDSDGGAWRFDKTKSWYNESLNTVTRGSRREFPEVALLVATDSAFTIYDAKDGVMWMVFLRAGTVGAGGYLFLDQANPSCCAGIEGKLWVGTRNNAQNNSRNGLREIDFVSDNSFHYSKRGGSAGLNAHGSIAQRNTVLPKISSVGGINGNLINDVVAATINGVLYVAVATDGGVSIINWDAQTVVGITIANGSDAVAFSSVGALYLTFGNPTDNTEIGVWYSLPESDTTNAFADHIYTSGGIAPSLEFGSPFLNNFLETHEDGVVCGSAQGATILNESRLNESSSGVRYLRKDIITEMMYGDIRGMWPLINSPISDGDEIVDYSHAGTSRNDLVSINGATKITDAPYGAGFSFNGTNQYLQQETLDTNQGVLSYNGNAFDDASQDFTEWQTTAGDAKYLIAVTNDDASVAWGYLGAIVDATEINVFQDDALTTAGWKGTVGTPASYVVRKTMQNGLQTFSISCWFRTEEDATQGLISTTGLSVSDDDRQILLFKRSSGGGNDISVTIYTSSDNSIHAQANSTQGVTDGLWHHVVVVLDSTSLRLYLDGNLSGEDTTLAGDFEQTYRPFRVGYYNAGSTWHGDLAHPAFTAQVLTAQQIKEMYLAGLESLQAEQDDALSLGSGNYSKLQGSLNDVRDVAVGDDGKIYVATGNASGGAITVLNKYGTAVVDYYDASRNNSDNNADARTSTDFRSIAVVDDTLAFATSAETWLQRSNETLYEHFKSQKHLIAGNEKNDLNRLLESIGLIGGENGALFHVCRSFSTLTRGDAVVLDLTYTDGRTVANTTTASRTIYGIVESVRDDGDYIVQVRGVHHAAKVDGSLTSIVAGDMLGAHTGAGKLAKNTTDNNVHIECLEAVTTDTTAKVHIR